MKVIEVNMKIARYRLVVQFNIGNMFFRTDTFFLSFEHDRGAVGVVGAKVQGVVAAQVLESDPDVRLDLLQHMTQMKVAVGVGQGAGDEYFAGLSHGVNSWA